MVVSFCFVKIESGFINNGLFFDEKGLNDKSDVWMDGYDLCNMHKIGETNCVKMPFPCKKTKNTLTYLFINDITKT